jgi:hypothetical protein
VTYPHPAVAAFVATHFVAVKVRLDRAADRPHFRAHRVIWTPTIAIMDYRGAAHYQSPGFLPPDAFAAMLRVGLARTLVAWSRYDEAAAHLAAVADAPGGPMAAEALFWLGAARYLQTRHREPMMQAWRRLRAEHPGSVWAARVPPNQEAFEES